MMESSSNLYYEGQQYDADDRTPLVNRSGGSSPSGRGARRRRPAAGEMNLSAPSLSFGSPADSHFSDTDQKDNKTKYNGKPGGDRFRIGSLLMCGICTPASEEDGEHFYRDDFNDQSWDCSFGTSDENGIWLNMRDQAGLVMSTMVWILMLYSCVTFAFLSETGGITIYSSAIYCILCSLALASHAKTTLTDPGTVPQSAVPVESERIAGSNHSMCSQCQTFKPPFSHHCRICNRCISRMDHHCPWMNNCIGAGNFKHFILFLLYTWLCSGFALILLGWNYFVCADEDCIFTPVLIQLVRIMTLLGIGAFLFTSSMLMNVCYGIMTGIGTIDRLKKKANNTLSQSDEESVDLKDIFGVGSMITWILPVDPLFEDFDRVVGYSTPQRLLREQIRESPNAPANVSSFEGSFSHPVIRGQESFPV